MAAWGETVEVEKVALLVEEWVAQGGRVGSLPGAQERYARRVLAREQKEGCELGAVDRLLVALGLGHLLAELHPHRRPGRAGYFWPRPHPLRKLTPEQVKAAHRLHWEGGLSLRELGRQLHERLGYASAHSCASALSEAFKRDALPRRDRIAATVAASTTHGRGARSEKAAYKRWHRAEFGPWPSDLANTHGR